MKTIMIVGKDNEFSNRIKQTIQGEDISIITAATNRDAFNYHLEHENVDLFLIPSNHSKEDEKEYLACKSTDSLSTLMPTERLLFDGSSDEELKMIIKNNLQSDNGTFEKKK